jgi:hypothetical protein
MGVVLFLIFSISFFGYLIWGLFFDESEEKAEYQKTIDYVKHSKYSICTATILRTMMEELDYPIKKTSPYFGCPGYVLWDYCNHTYLFGQDYKEHKKLLKTFDKIHAEKERAEAEAIYTKNDRSYDYLKNVQADIQKYIEKENETIKREAIKNVEYAQRCNRL